MILLILKSENCLVSVCLVTWSTYITVIKTPQLERDGSFTLPVGGENCGIKELHCFKPVSEHWPSLSLFGFLVLHSPVLHRALHWSMYSYW